MKNFDKKVSHLNSLFMYKFRVYDYENKKLKIYYISPDNSHIYISVDIATSNNQTYCCEVGELYFDKSKRNTFEDTPTEIFDIDKTDYKTFRKQYDKTPSWVNHKITEIINSYDNKEGIDLVF
jgi:hypothetical protein